MQYITAGLRPGADAMDGKTSFRTQTRGEEIANSVSHGAALIAALMVLPLLLLDARGEGTAALVGASVFGTTVVLLYLSSTIYHSLPAGRAKNIFQILDHGAIYLLIAGTYTPFTLGVLRGPWGWSLFALVWTIATAGVVMKIVVGVRHPRLSTAGYLAMGWLFLIAAKPLWNLVPGWGLFWLAAGGLAYTVGVAFFLAPRMRYAHFIWHLFVIAGTACHMVAVMQYSSQTP